jgi:hypothetical protein
MLHPLSQNLRLNSKGCTHRRADTQEYWGIHIGVKLFFLELLENGKDLIRIDVVIDKRE